jgi:hypothetical protein
MVARISRVGYATKELTLTEGPINWVSLNGRSHGDDWLLKSGHFQVELQPISETFAGVVSANVSGTNAGLQHELSFEDVVRGRADWKRTLEVLKSRKVTLRAMLDP